MHPTRKSHWSQWVLIAALAGLGSTYTVAAIHRLVSDVPGSYPIDLRLRWIEERLVLEGRNPDVVGHPDPELPRTHEVMRANRGGYPAWSYSIGLLLVPPFEWPVTRWYFAALSLASLCAISACAWTLLAGHGRRVAAVGALLPFATFPAAICISYGQYAVPISALQFGAVVLLERSRTVTAGVLLGLGLVKPQLTALFCAGLAFQRRYRAVASVLFVVLAATILASVLAGTDLNPLSWGTVGAFRSRGIETHNPLLTAATSWLGRRVAVLLLAGVGATFIAAVAMRGAVTDPLSLASLTAIVTMYWSYRKHFDAALMTIPLLWLWRQYAHTRHRADLAAFLAVGFSVWIPIRDTQWTHPVVLSVHTVLWTWAAWRIATHRHA